MNEQNTKHLTKNYPILYQLLIEKPKAGEMLMPMIFGFCVGDGWFKIIDELSAKIEEYNKGVSENRAVVAEQVKEKFGTLRYYIGSAPQFIHEAVHEAEQKSAETCEDCGGPASMMVSMYGWYTNICKECIEKSGKGYMSTKEYDKMMSRTKA